MVFFCFVRLRLEAPLFVHDFVHFKVSQSNTNVEEKQDNISNTLVNKRAPFRPFLACFIFVLWVSCVFLSCMFIAILCKLLFRVEFDAFKLQYCSSCNNSEGTSWDVPCHAATLFQFRYEWWELNFAVWFSHTVYVLVVLIYIWNVKIWKRLPLRLCFPSPS